VRATQGFERPDRALLLIAGESQIAKVKGEVLLVRQAGAWKVRTEYTQLDVE
jgi:hypothetical protein